MHDCLTVGVWGVGGMESSKLNEERERENYEKCIHESDSRKHIYVIKQDRM